MILSFLKILIRNLIRHPSMTAINLLGFSAGIAVAVMIFSFVNKELHFETFHQRADRIYRANLHLQIEGTDKEVSVSPNILGPVMLERIPGIEKYVRMTMSLNTTTVLRVDDEFHKIPEVFVSDSIVAEVFTLDMLKGDTSQLLTRPEDALLSEKTAVLFYGSTDVLGRTFTGSGGDEYIIRGIFRDFPVNSHLRPKVFLSAINSQITGELQWNNSNYFTYLLIDEQAEIEQIEQQLAGIVQEEAPEWMKQMQVAFSLMPITDIHLYSKADFEPSPTGDIRQIYASIVIAVFILVIASVNYINLSTSRSLERAREVGLRKMMGGVKGQLVFQFLLESFVITFLSVLLAFLIILLVLPYFNELIDIPLSEGEILNVRVAMLMLTGWVVLSLLAGLYPAFFMTAYRPVQVLKGSFSKSKKGAAARKSLVVFQFIISTVLIIGTFVVYRQIDFMQNRNLGFDREHTLVLMMSRVPEDEVLSALKNSYLSHSNIRAVSFTSAYPTRNSGGQLLEAEGLPDDEQMLVWEWRVEEDILEAFGFKLIAGRGFTRNSDREDQKDFIVNETTVKILGWSPEEALGRTLDISGDKGICIGVVEDFHFTSLKNEVEPLVLNVKNNYRNHIVIRLGDSDLRSTMSYIEEEWKKQLPEAIFDYHFLDEAFNQAYRNERRTGRMFTGFSLLAIIIAGLGLFGLSTYETQVRTKEIGIRKALGSTTFGIFKLLIGNYTVLVLISFLVSVPLSYLIMSRWLDGFAYHVNIGPGQYLLAAIITFMILLLSVGYRSVLAAHQNPVNSLRYE